MNKCRCCNKKANTCVIIAKTLLPMCQGCKDIYKKVMNRVRGD